MPIKFRRSILSPTEEDFMEGEGLCSHVPSFFFFTSQTEAFAWTTSSYVSTALRFRPCLL